MIIQRKKITDLCQSIIHILVAVLICSFTVLSTYTWGGYVMIGCLFLILLLDAAQQKMVYRFRISKYIGFMVLFTAYVWFTCLVAINPAETVTHGITLLEMILMVFVLEQVYSRQEKGVENLLSILKWTSYVIVIYSILFYGLGTLLQMAAAGDRMDNRYANVNIIGMMAAVGVVIQLDEMLRKRKFKFGSIFCIFSIFVLAVTQSRKALLLLLVGIVMVSLLNSRAKNWMSAVVKLLFTALILVLAVRFVTSLEIFGGMMERFTDMMEGLLGVTEGDASTSLRTRMIQAGMTQFVRTPIFGVGIGNAHIVGAREIGVDAYLHNNFIELLCGGGIVGFCLYYMMYVSLLASFIKYRKQKDSTYVICLTLTVLMLVMDYGRVTYYDKMNYVYLLIFFLETAALKKAAKKAA